MAKLAVIYWSASGNTEAMANAVLDGAKAAGADASLFSVSDISAADAAGYDALALGCPAMGSEELEDSEFQPFYDELKGSLSGKKIVLFGSYDWGDGEWMRTWTDDAKAAGAVLAADSLIVNLTPDDDGLAQCKALGEALAKA